MKAIVQTQYGPPNVLQLKEVAKPMPKEDEVLIEVQAASVSYSDWVYVRGKPLVARLMGSGLLKPNRGPPNGLGAAQTK
jgi:NADPH:quinone reductase-like Zn-dependent oxidoreductase